MADESGENVDQGASHYAPGYAEARIGFMEKRRGVTHAAFLLPYLSDQSRVLDCGCGPGTITNDLAACVKGGFVIGIDVNKAQTQRAQRHARDLGIQNAFYIEQNVTALDFSDDSFDVVFSEALLDHVPDTEKAVSEMVRVLRPGGLLALRSPDWSGLAFDPPTESGLFLVEAYKNRIAAAGGHPFMGQQLSVCMGLAGLENIKVSRGQEIHDAPSGFLLAIGEAVLPTSVNRNQANALIAEAQTWAKRPQATIREIWTECVGFKRGS